MSKKDLTEEDIKLRFITPAINNAGWRYEHIRMEYYFTDGRVIFQGKVHARQTGKKADYLLFHAANKPIAIVEAKDNSKPLGGGMQQAMEYAQILDIPFAYSSNGDGFLEHDFLTGKETELSLEQFPTPDALYQRLIKTKQLDKEALKIVEQPFYSDQYTYEPRYYQRIAVERTVEAIAKGKDRVLIVMATGTGKTITAFQIIHRLKASGAKKKILYLADRNILIDQTMVQDFKPFKKVMTKIQGAAIDSAYEVHMALYHQLVSNEEGVEDPFRQVQPTFFDLIIVDECHRGSAKDDSAWRKVLEYFNTATQIGMTATPKAENGANNLDYFGEPVFTYSLLQGIQDGFLAPYRVTNSYISIDLQGFRDSRYVMRITGDDNVGKKQLDNFIDVDQAYPTIVTTSELLATGVDCKTCGLIVIDKEIGSMTEFKQIIGRGTRLRTDKGKWHLEILDFRNATAKFKDPKFDGDSEPPQGKNGKPYTIPDEPSSVVSEPHVKYLVEGEKIAITTEIVSVLGEDGKTMRTESITDFTRKQIRKRYATLNDFVKNWTEAERKKVIVDELKDYSILVDAVREKNPALAHADIFDVICHVAYDQPPMARRERANNVKKRNYFAKYEGKAREVLEALLDKYADYGILNLEDSDILDTDPFNKIGKPQRIVKLFGGIDKYEQALIELENEIYKTA